MTETIRPAPATTAEWRERLLTRVAEATHYEPDAPLPPSLFEFEFPEGTTLLY